MRRLLTLVIPCLVSFAARAHHSPAAYDQSTPVFFKGTITKVGWVNPHIYFTLAVPGPDGTTVEQEIQAGSISVNTSLGLKKEELAVGSEITVRAFPNRRGGRSVAWGLDFTTSNGEIRPLDLLGRVNQPRSTVAATSMAGRWTPSVSSVRTVMVGMRTLPLSEGARAASADLDGQRTADANCTNPWSAPRVMLLPVLRTIELSATTARIEFDWMGVERTIHLDQAEHPQNIVPSAQGHSIGHWEGESLVIDTIGFAPDRAGIAPGIPSGTRKRLVERLSLTEDRLRLQYDFTIEDPESFSGEGSYTAFWEHRPDLEPSGEPCNAENAGRFLREE